MKKVQAFTKPIIETHTLAKLLGTEKIRLVHAIYNPGKPEESRDLYLDKHLPGATLFNPDVIRDRSKPYPFMMPIQPTFIEYVKAANLQRTDKIVCYDDRGVFISPRVWWMLKVMGAQNVAVLNGGLPKWESEGYKVQKGELEYEEYQKGDFDYKLDEETYYRFEDIVNWEKKKDLFNLIEARPGVQEPGKHIQGAQMMPFVNFQNKSEKGYTTMKSPEEIKQIFEQNGPDLQKKSVFTCGAAITACIDALAFNMAYGDEKKFGVYDGSFSEYSARSKQ